MQVFCVLRSGGIYTPEYVSRLREGVLAHLPGATFACLSDQAVPDRVPLKYDWPGWWAKMELFRPDLTGDLLYFDLDTVIVGGLEDIARVNTLTVLRDFYHARSSRRRNGIGSGMMFLPEADRAPLWEEWIKRPDEWMKRCGGLGDQNFLEHFWKDKGCRWQDIYPGQVVSYKVHCTKNIPQNARAVCFHGKPRPHEVQWLM